MKVMDVHELYGWDTFHVPNVIMWKWRNTLTNQELTLNISTPDGLGLQDHSPLRPVGNPVSTPASTHHLALSCTDRRPIVFTWVLLLLYCTHSTLDCLKQHRVQVSVLSWGHFDYCAGTRETKNQNGSDGVNTQTNVRRTYRSLQGCGR